MTQDNKHKDTVSRKSGPQFNKNLPQSVRYADSLDSFKQKLKFYLFNSRFNVLNCLCMCTPVMPYRPGFSL